MHDPDFPCRPRLIHAVQSVAPRIVACRGIAEDADSGGASVAGGRAAGGDESEVEPEAGPNPVGRP